MRGLGLRRIIDELAISVNKAPSDAVAMEVISNIDKKATELVKAKSIKKEYEGR